MPQYKKEPQSEAGDLNTTDIKKTTKAVLWSLATGVVALGLSILAVLTDIAPSDLPSEIAVLVPYFALINGLLVLAKQYLTDNRKS